MFGFSTIISMILLACGDCSCVKDQRLRTNMTFLTTFRFVMHEHSEQKLGKLVRSKTNVVSDSLGCPNTAHQLHSLCLFIRVTRLAWHETEGGRDHRRCSYGEITVMKCLFEMIFRFRIIQPPSFATFSNPVGCTLGLPKQVEQFNS